MVQIFFFGNGTDKRKLVNGLGDTIVLCESSHIYTYDTRTMVSYESMKSP